MLDDSAALQMLGGGPVMQTRKGLHGVSVLSPDPDKHVRVGGASDMGFMVPMADLMTGSPPGFDQSKAGMVVINPDESGKGTLIDFSKLTPDDVNRAMRMGSDPSDAMEKLAKLHPPRSAAVVQPRQVPVERVILNQLPRVVQHPQAMLPPANPPSINPPRVILPGFATVGQPQHIPQEQPMQAQPPMMMMAPPASQTWTSPAPSVAQPALPNPNAPMYPAQQPDALSVIMQTLMGMQQQIDSLRPQQVQPFVQEARQPDYTPLETEAIADLSALEIPWLTPVVMPPTVDVMFNLGDAGGVRTKYHHVEITDALILLIYDSRFEMATQYTPPFTRTREAGPLILQIGKSKSQHQAHHYPGLDFALGVYHVTLLMKVVLEPEDPVDPANVI